MIFGTYPYDTDTVNITVSSGTYYSFEDEDMELIPCPDGILGCCVAHYRKRVDPEQLRRAELIDNEISGIFE